MGKGDKRTRRGKIFAGSFGKTRPKDKKSGGEKTTAKGNNTENKDNK